MKSLKSMSAVVAVVVLSACPETSPPAHGPGADGGPGVEGAVSPGDQPGGVAPGVMGGSPMAAQAPTDGTMPSGPAPSITDSQSAGPAVGGTFAGTIPESERIPRFTQDDLADDDAVTVSGTLACGDCEGKLLIRVLPPPPDTTGAGGGPPEIQLITFKAFDGPGPFEMLLPRSENVVVLQVVDDADSDGQPSTGERMGMPTDGPLVLTEKTAGIALQVGSFPEAPAVDPMGNPMQVAPEGGAATIPGPDAATEGLAADPTGEGAAEGAVPPTGG